MYESPSDPPNDGNSKEDIWSALASTERWIDETLSTSNTANSKQSSNPYSRKEISYVCEASENIESIIANVFRRLVDARETGDKHGEKEIEMQAALGPRYVLQTLRETLVIVVPSSNELSSNFKLFDKLVSQINSARRNARDLQRLSSSISSSNSESWGTTVNMSHMHPLFGQLTPSEQLEEDLQNELDLNLKAYKEKRNLARRSPYPTIVIEVRSSPPNDIHRKPSEDQPYYASRRIEPEDSINRQDVRKLEALFGKGASFEHPMEGMLTQSTEEDFYDCIGKLSGIQEMTFSSSIHQAQWWIATHVSTFDALRSSFHVSDSKYVDMSYEFVFRHLSVISNLAQNEERETYLVMPEFCPTSCTSFEKFRTDILDILNILPQFQSKVDLEVFHPEHIDKNRRSPMPILVILWL